MIEFRVLGPVEMWVGDQRVDLGPERQRSVLAAILVDPERALGIRTLVDRVWGESPPDGVRNVIYTYVARLRRALLAATEATHTPVTLSRGDVGYRLGISPDQVDLHRFRALVSRARATPPDAPERGVLLRQALHLWRGEALAGLNNEWASRFRDSLRQLRHETLAECADTEIRVGRGDAVIDELRHVLLEAPMAELLHERLVRALYAGGQRAEALAQYERARRTIADELGTAPGSGLQELYRLMLRGEPLPSPRGRLIAVPDADPELPTAAGLRIVTAADPGDPAEGGPVPLATVDPRLAGVAYPRWAGTGGGGTAPRGQDPAAAVGPDLLPVDLADFTGRARDVGGLTAILTARDGGTPPIVVIRGAGGVGKTALAVHTAHRVRQAFPGGRLYAELRGNGEAPARPAAVLSHFLTILGADPQELPACLGELTALYRNRLAGRRVLVVLDDAADAEQVVPLLPAGAGCAVLVTARAPLSMPAGARPWSLGELSEPEGVELLARLVGNDRVVADLAAAVQLVRVCEGIPLALRAVADRLVARPHLTLHHLLGRATDEERRLDELAYGTVDIRTRLAHSYSRLDSAASRVFRRLGSLTCPDGYVVAGELTGLDPNDAEETLERLVDHHLLRVAGHDALGRTRYQLRALHRIYARSVSSPPVSRAG
ncbi:BTAD domain-containing putative transcriptional regulator [Streptomyces sp. NPDC057638]|uniref:AfsR/SARP family transcriptional regulator n=1 Tax=Streptomyces sp. NPDC057638 TaxID=3346190 RepID=UPI00368E61C5